MASLMDDNEFADMTNTLHIGILEKIIKKIETCY